jgi:hypothetical protein
LREVVLRHPSKEKEADSVYTADIVNTADSVNTTGME